MHAWNGIIGEYIKYIPGIWHVEDREFVKKQGQERNYILSNVSTYQVSSSACYGIVYTRTVIWWAISNI